MTIAYASSPEAADEGLARVQRIVVVCMENRAFDHFLGHRRLAGPNGEPPPLDPEVDGLRGREWNIHDGQKYEVFRLPDTFFPVDLKHSPTQVRTQLGGIDGIPPMGGFSKSFQTVLNAFKPDPPGLSPGSPMGFHTSDQLPALHRLAEEFCVCDRWFSSFAGPTWPNRMFLYCGHSGGLIENLHLGEELKKWNADRKDRKEERKENREEIDGLWERHEARQDLRQEQREERREERRQGLPQGLQYLRQMPNLNLFDLLDDKQWRVYHAGALSWLFLLPFQRLRPGHLRPFRNLADDIKKGDVPPVVFIDPDYDTGKTANDDHTPCNVLSGQAFLAELLDALLLDPAAFSTTLLVLLYDEHGGWYDHVDPRKEQPTGDEPPFHHYGVRVPAILAGGGVPRRSVCHVLFDHTSVAATILRRFRPQVSLDRLSRRVADANHFGWALTQFPLRTDFLPAPRIARPSLRNHLEPSEFSEWVNGVRALRGAP